MAVIITKSMLRAKINKINQYREPKIMLVTINGENFIGEVKPGGSFKPICSGGTKPQLDWFLEGMLRNAGTNHIPDEQLLLAYRERERSILRLIAADEFKNYICYENVVDGPEELAEFEETYGHHPDELLKPSSIYFILDKVVDRYLETRCVSIAEAVTWENALSDILDQVRTENQD